MYKFITKPEQIRSGIGVISAGRRRPALRNRYWNSIQQRNLSNKSYLLAIEKAHDAGTTAGNGWLITNKSEARNKL